MYDLANVLFLLIYQNYLLNFKSSKFLLSLGNQNCKTFIKKIINNHFAILATNKFRTNTGGVAYYNSQLKQKYLSTDTKISYSIQKQISHQTLIWLSEETYKLDCDRSVLLVEHNNFISENFEIVPGTFSKTAGIVIITQKNNIVKKVVIKSGSVYEGKKFENLNRKVFFPGEVIFENIKITQPSFCEHIIGKFNDQLLIRPLEIYELPRSKSIKSIFGRDSQIQSIFHLENSINYLYKSTQNVRSGLNKQIE